MERECMFEEIMKEIQNKTQYKDATINDLEYEDREFSRVFEFNFYTEGKGIFYDVIGQHDDNSYELQITAVRDRGKENKRKIRLEGVFNSQTASPYE